MSKKYVNPSGFTENLPSEQIVEEMLKEKFRLAAESYGYLRLETSSVEYMDTLSSETNAGREIYRIVRSQVESEDIEDSERGLHFDLTVPFARYTAQNYGDLRFPFRRYQIQKVWRGERPQKGRFREFYQADVDVVGNDNLPIQYDSEVISVMASILNSMDIGTITMKINNRKFLTGLLENYNIQNSDKTLQQIDKIDKIGINQVKQNISEFEPSASHTLGTLFELLTKKIGYSELISYLKQIPDSNNTSLKEGKEELLAVFKNLPRSNSKGYEKISFMFDPCIARGLDYYTGTVCETTINSLEKYGSICSGGRYADLASKFTNKKLPGVGLSIGLTRLMSIIKEEKLIDFSKKTNTLVAICIQDEKRRMDANKIATSLRIAKINVEVNHKITDELSKQIKSSQAEKIKFVLICKSDSNYTVYNTETDKKAYCTNLKEIKQFIKEKPSKDIKK